jgi:hypothetical protein
MPSFVNFCCCKVALASLLKSNLTRLDESRELLSELTCWKDHVYAKLIPRKETIIAFISFLLHHLRYVFISTYYYVTLGHLDMALNVIPNYIHYNGSLHPAGYSEI